MPSVRSNLATVRGQRGYTLLEIMIAMVIGLSMLGGLLTLEQYNRTAFSNQSQLAQLQDNERMVMTIIADVIQSAGYFPDPTSNTASLTLTASGSFATSQTVTGTYSATAPGDTISVRYMTASGDGVLNCSGSSNATGGNQLYVNTFSVVNGQLVCSMNGTPYTLVGGVQSLSVQSLSVLYGVKTDFTVDNNNVDIYLTAAQMTATNWKNVISVMVTLTFNNPLYVAGQGQPQTLTVQRVVGVMSKIGIKA